MSSTKPRFSYTAHPLTGNQQSCSKGRSTISKSGSLFAPLRRRERRTCSGRQVGETPPRVSTPRHRLAERTSIQVVAPGDLQAVPAPSDWDGMEGSERQPSWSYGRSLPVTFPQLSQEAEILRAPWCQQGAAQDHGYEVRAGRFRPVQSRSNCSLQQLEHSGSHV